jgi:hypothetical protein
MQAVEIFPFHVDAERSYLLRHRRLRNLDLQYMFGGVRPSILDLQPHLMSRWRVTKIVGLDCEAIFSWVADDQLTSLNSGEQECSFLGSACEGARPYCLPKKTVAMMTCQAQQYSANVVAGGLGLLIIEGVSCAFWSGGIHLAPEWRIRAKRPPVNCVVASGWRWN